MVPIAVERPARSRETRPLIRTPLPDAPGPRGVLAALDRAPGRVLLESVGPEGRYTVLSQRPWLHLVSGSEGTRILDERGAEIGEADDPFSALDRLLSYLGVGHGGMTDPGPPDASIHPFRPFAGAAIGFLAYEAGRHLERLPSAPSDDVGLPEAWFGLYDSALIWDRRTGECEAVAAPIPGGRDEALLRDGLEALVECARAASHVGRTAAAGRVGSGGWVRPGRSRRAEETASSLERGEFVAGVRRIREYIRAGDLFQANLTRRISVSTPLSGTELYDRLVSESPSDLSAFLDTGDGEIASVSPELFLSSRNGRVRTCPIKGTAPRGKTDEDDRARRIELASSAKDRAENVMIVDLLRNDLSRVCRPGSIGVPRLAEIETHPTVHHLVSTVTGTLGEGIGPVELLRSTFPGGSITGAPKIRAVEVLSELEPVRRGVYTGALGAIGAGGDLDLSVAIRTSVLKSGRAHYGTGAGITLSSDPDAEWLETEDKALAFLNAIRGSEER